MDSVAATDSRVATEPRPGPPRGLYVHVPFCVSLCPYCDFVVYPGAAARGPRAKVRAFLAALGRELDLRADRLDRAFGPPGSPGRPALETLYLGGGTPSLLPADAIADLVSHVRARFGLADGAEVTLEANPGPTERGEPAAQRVAGVTRLSIGAQSLDPAALRRLGRRHAPGDVAEAVAQARAAGLSSVSLDLLYDVPGQTLGSWIEELEAALALRPDHLSLYALTLDEADADSTAGAGTATGPERPNDRLPATRGARRWRAAARRAQDDDRAAAMYHHALVRLAEAGFEGYEISNWARPGHASRHNRLYWQHQPVAALGPGAHAFDGLARTWTAASLERYLAALVPAGGGPAALPPGGEERLDPGTLRVEATILGLRLREGVPLEAAFQPPLAEAFGWALAAELLEVAGEPGAERVRLTARGRLLSNELFARLV